MRSVQVDSPKQSFATPETETDQNLVPSQIRGPVALLLTWTFPLLILALCNAHAFWLAWSEMRNPERTIAYLWTSFQIINIGASLALAFWIHSKKQRLNALTALLPLALQVAYLLFASLSLEDWYPRSLQSWMLSSERILLQQWTFAMLPAFFSALVISGFHTNAKRSHQIGYMASALIGAPLAIYLTFVLMSSLNFGLGGIATAVAMVLFAACVTAFGIAVLRLLLGAWKRCFESSSRARLSLIAFVALILPLSGLLLNRAIPFPVSFQHPGVYALALLNAFFLALPTSESSRRNLLIWIANCLLLPFSLYFFLVFLPFLPLSLPAMLIAGAGILMLAPTALFVIHIQKLAHVFQKADRHPAAYWSIGALSFLCLPLVLVAEAKLVKQQLNRSIDFVLTPDLQAPQRYDGIPYLGEKSIDWLNAFKSGQHFPIITPLRMELLFGGLTLPDAKMERIYKTLTGEEMPELRSNDFSLLGDNARGAPALRQAPTPPPLPSASLRKVESRAIPSNVDTELTLNRIAIEMQGSEARESEFKATLELPPGALVNGFALYIGDERVEGRLFEESTSLWVYRMIRDSERWKRLPDPATLTIDPDGILQLQVFPFTPNQIRRVEIDVLSLSHDFGAIQTSELAEPFELTPVIPTSKIQRIQRFDTDNSVRLYLPPLPSLAPYAFHRKAYAHILVDRSKHGFDDEEIENLLESSRPPQDDLPIQITAVNLEAETLFPQPSDWNFALENLQNEALSQRFPRRRGLHMEAALKRATLANPSPEHAVEYYPKFVVLSKSDWKANTPELNPYLKLHPEIEEIETKLDLAASAPTAVLLLRCGDFVRAVKANEAACIDFLNMAPSEPIQIYDSINKRWKNLDTVSAIENKHLLEIASLELLANRAELNPAFEEGNRSHIVSESKRLNLLTPLTAFTVVENDAQWKTLEMREHQKLAAHGALEFDETPEPSLWLLLAGLAFAKVLQRRWKNRRTPYLGTSPVEG